MATDAERIALVELQQSYQSRAIAAILADHYDDGAESAKAMLVALDPDKYADLAVVEKANAPKADAPPDGGGGDTDYEPTVRWVASAAGPQGTFGRTPSGVLLHGSRSGNAGLTRTQEFDNTSGWAANPSNTLGWSITCGEDEYDRHVDEDEWGWNAYDASHAYLACEFAQAVEAWDITDAQVNAFCHWFATQARVAWPSLPLHFPSHAEVEHSGETGHGVTGKTDAFSYGSPRMDELRGRILARLDSQYGIR